MFCVWFFFIARYVRNEKEIFPPSGKQTRPRYARTITNKKPDATHKQIIICRTCLFMVVTQRSALHSVTWLYSHEDAIENASKSLSLISISRLTLALLMHLNSCNKKKKQHKRLR